MNDETICTLAGLVCLVSLLAICAYVEVRK